MVSRMMRKRLALIAAFLLVWLGVTCVTVPTASAASGTISGTIDCFYGNNDLVGVWVNATSGADDWATISGDGRSYSYTLSQTSTYKLHVGCSGTPSNWGATMYTPVVNGQYYNWVCSYSTSMGFYCAAS